MHAKGYAIILINGEMDVSYSGDKLEINVEWCYRSGTVTLNYNVGESFSLHVCDKLYSDARAYYGSHLILEYTTEKPDDDWNDGA